MLFAAALAQAVVAVADDVQDEQADSGEGQPQAAVNGLELRCWVGAGGNFADVGGQDRAIWQALATTVDGLGADATAAGLRHEAENTGLGSDGWTSVRASRWRDDD